LENSKSARDPSPKWGPHRKFRIVAKHSNKVLDMAGTEDGAKAVQYGYLARENQHFTVLPVGDGHFQIMASHSQKFLDASSKCIVQNRETGGDSQQFKFEKAGDGKHYVIIAKHSGKVVDVWCKSKEDMAAIVQHPALRGDNQFFRFEEV